MSGIGASDAIAVMGVSPWLTPNELWAVKTERKRPQKSMPWMRRGLELEPIARREYERLTGIKVESVCVEHDSVSYLLATLDGVNFTHQKLVEIKCPGEKDHAMALRGRIPDKYVWQLVHQLAITGYSQMDYFSFDGERGVILSFKRDLGLEKRLLHAHREFWKSVVRDIEPTPPKVESSFQESLAKVIAFRGRK